MSIRFFSAHNGHVYDHGNGSVITLDKARVGHGDVVRRYQEIGQTEPVELEAFLFIGAIERSLREAINEASTVRGAR